MPATAQWTKSPPGASGSRITSTSSWVPVGTPDHCSGSDTSSPSHVYRDGIDPPSLNAGLETWKPEARPAPPEAEGVVLEDAAVVDVVVDELVVGVACWIVLVEAGADAVPVALVPVLL